MGGGEGWGGEGKSNAVSEAGRSVQAGIPSAPWRLPLRLRPHCRWWSCRSGQAASGSSMPTPGRWVLLH